MAIQSLRHSPLTGFRHLQLAPRAAHRPPGIVKLFRRSFGMLFVAGAVTHIVLVTVFSESYTNFADQSPIEWITATWRSVAVPNVEFLIPLLAIFELVVGVLILGKAWRAKIGLTAAIVFHVALTLFGLWPYTIPAMALLLLMLQYDYGPAFGRVHVRHPEEQLRPAA